MMKETMSCGGENYDLFFLTIQDEKTKMRKKVPIVVPKVAFLGTFGTTIGLLANEAYYQKCYPDSDTPRHRNSAKKTDCHLFYMILNELIIQQGHYRLSPYLVRLNVFISTKVPFE